MTYELQITDIIDETPDTKTFIFNKPSDLNFKPGEHTMISIPGIETKKPFTFSSAPEDNFIGITIKLNGEFTEKLFEKQIGDSLELTSSAGDGLKFKDTYSESLLLLATGSGVTPFMSLIRHLNHVGINKDVTLIYGNKTSSDIIFKDELANLPSNFKVINVISREDSKFQGRISADLILSQVPDLNKRRWVICGMAPFVISMVDLARKYVDEDKIMTEMWYKS